MECKCGSREFIKEGYSFYCAKCYVSVDKKDLPELKREIDSGAISWRSPKNPLGETERFEQPDRSQYQKKYYESHKQQRATYYKRWYKDNAEKWKIHVKIYQAQKIF